MSASLKLLHNSKYSSKFLQMSISGMSLVVESSKTIVLLSMPVLVVTSRRLSSSAYCLPFDFCF